ncbi:MAG: ATP-dependent protease ATPase subunit HslU, partial [Nitrospinae bacterium]|nr:ATP-dependent protease ATPase subunit HslU [Nitrospinota bacterium]
PSQIVKELDKYIIGQNEAKRSVAIALRNRWRRQQLSDDMRNEVAPKNIIMIGPTGVGKTEIARRLAHLTSSPFIKVEASKFTEVGYVGRDVESMIRDLMEISKNLVRTEFEKHVEEKAQHNAEEAILDILLPLPEVSEANDAREKHLRNRERFRQKLKNGEFDDREVTFEVEEKNFPSIEIFSPMGQSDGLDSNIKDMMSSILPAKKKAKKLKVPDALKHAFNKECSKLIDMDMVIEEAKKRVEDNGVIFIDEIDKIASREKQSSDVSREGVQRDLLPIVEGSTVSTKYGMIKTDHILFIAAGAFHVSKPSDLIPELQGRFPIRVELNSLTKDDFIKILTEPKNALIRQYTSLMETEDFIIIFKKDAIEKIAEISTEVNQKMENIGARRLHTIMERLLTDFLFDVPDQINVNEVVIDKKFVEKKLSDVVKDEDLSRYIL